MLDRAKVLKALELARQDLFVDNSTKIEKFLALWKAFAHDTPAQERLQELFLSQKVPTWHGSVNRTIPIERALLNYVALSVDGSQIYPDRHQGTACHLINIGSVSLSYQKQTSKAIMHSEPYIFTCMDLSHGDNPIDHVNARRQELELQRGYAYAKQLKQQQLGLPLVFLFDGALIFWHLQSKEKRFKQIHLSSYLHILEKFYQDRIPLAGYISLPKNKELIDVLMLYHKQTSLEAEIDFSKEVLDQTLVRRYLPEYSHSTIFYTHAPIVHEYPQHLQPCFFYLNTPYEVARIELPAWLAQDEKLLSMLGAIIVDQVEKGRGYPICIAEAHEQAVIKGQDRDFFYHLIQKLSVEEKQFFISSRKSQRKKMIGF